VETIELHLKLFNLFGLTNSLKIQLISIETIPGRGGGGNEGQ
jgi:hypothetical protein